MSPLATRNSTFNDVVGSVISLINLAIPVLLGLALVIFFYGLFKYVSSAGNPQTKGADKSAILWGLIALFVVFSVGGLLRVVCSTFIGTPSCNAPTAVDLMPDDL